MAYTSIKTTGGWSDNTVTEAYDLLFRLALDSQPICRQFVDVRPGNVTHRGDSVTMQIKNNFSESDVISAMTPLDEESDVTPTKLPATSTVTLTPNEFGFTNLRTLKLKNRSMVDIDPEIARAVANHCGKVVDRLVQTEMRGTLPAGHTLYGGSATSTVTVAAGGVATADQIREAVTVLREENVEERDSGFFVGVFHPRVLLALRTESGSGAWRTPKEYVDPGEIYRGEIGEFEGVRFIRTNSTYWSADSDDGASAIPVYRSFVLGREALAESVVEEPHFVLSPVTDSLKRNQGCGWYGDLDFGLYRKQALVRLENAAV